MRMVWMFQRSMISRAFIIMFMYFSAKFSIIITQPKNVNRLNFQTQANILFYMKLDDIDIDIKCIFPRENLRFCLNFRIFGGVALNFFILETVYKSTKNSM